MVLETVKPCEDAQRAYILRAYECEGSYADTSLSLAPGCSAMLCDMMEQPQTPVSGRLQLHPFQIQTIRVTYPDKEETL